MQMAVNTNQHDPTTIFECETMLVWNFILLIKINNMTRKQSVQKTPSLSDKAIDWNKYKIYTEGNVEYHVPMIGYSDRDGQFFELFLLVGKSKREYLVRTEYKKGKSTDRVYTSLTEAKKRFADIYKQKTKNVWGETHKPVKGAHYTLAAKPKIKSISKKSSQKKSKTQTSLPNRICDDDVCYVREDSVTDDESNDEDYNDLSDLFLDDIDSFEESLDLDDSFDLESLEELTEDSLDDLSELDDANQTMDDESREISESLGFNSFLEEESVDEEQNTQKTCGLTIPNKRKALTQIKLLSTRLGKMQQALDAITARLSQ
jgi:hypothetical protein